MAVVIETTLGDITVDLYLEQRPVTCLNFLKLCKMKYYNFNLFHSIRSGFIAQTGDPTGEGTGGESIWGILEGQSKRFFSGEKMPKIRHTEAGLLSMVCTDDMMVGSQFFFTLAPDLDSLDGTHCVIGEVTEGHEVLSKLNEAICDESHRPYRDIRITHTVVLEDPFSDPPGLRAPSRSPSPSAERLKGGRIAPDEEIDETEGKTAEEIQEMIEDKEAKARATILEIVGDLPDADIAPPENVLFVCKLNPVTTDDDLEIIFSRFGTIVCCEVIRDKKTGNSLQYAFIEFDNKKSCEDAYFKMDNVLIDDRRIHVDFSQSVSKMRWLGKGRGVQYFNDDNSEASHEQKHSRRPPSRDRDRNRNRHNNEVDDRRYRRNESRHNTSSHRSDRYKNERSKRGRSRSRSRHEESRSHRERDRKQERNNHDKRISDRHNNDYNGREKAHSTYKNNGNQNKSPSPRRHKEKEKVCARKEDEHNSFRNRNRENKIYESEDSHKKNKDKSKKHVEPKTPSPISDKNDGKSKSKSKGKETKESKSKRKRKVSESSSDSSTDTSSSTESSTTSSSESDKKKKKIRRKKRKPSTSSSSSSSSSSSESSSDSSNSSSNSEHNKKRHKKKVQLKKRAKKSNKH